MDRIITLERKRPKPNTDIIDTLEVLLEQAKKGQIQQISYVIVSDEGVIEDWIVGYAEGYEESFVGRMMIQMQVYSLSLSKDEE